MERLQEAAKHYSAFGQVSRLRCLGSEFRQILCQLIDCGYLSCVYSVCGSGYEREKIEYDWLLRTISIIFWNPLAENVVHEVMVMELGFDARFKRIYHLILIDSTLESHFAYTRRLSRPSILQIADPPRFPIIIPLYEVGLVE